MTNEITIKNEQQKLEKETPNYWLITKDLKECLKDTLLFIKEFVNMQMETNRDSLESFKIIFKSLSTIMTAVEACMQRIERIESKLW